MRVRRRLAVLGCFVLLAGLALTVVSYRAVDPIYDGADVQAGLRQQPRIWAGRVLLLRGVVTMQGLLVGCGRPSCPGMSWVILLPPHQPVWSQTQQLWVSMDISRLLTRPHPTVGNAGSHRALGIGRAIGQGLVLVVRPGFSPSSTHASGPLPDGAYHIPLLGPLLSHWLPEAKDNSVVVRVRLAPWHSCTIPGLCPDGWVI